MRPTISDGYSPGCIGRIAQLHASYYSESTGFGVEFEAKVAKELSDFCLSYVPGRDGLWLAHGTEIEGSIAIDGSHANQDGAHLRWFITSNSLRGTGVGKQLLGRALEFSDQCGYKKVYLWTFAGLSAARHLYESHGFCLQSENPGSQWGKVVHEQRFERCLTIR
jgi:GNAT superfamily N-acetyltransferase